ncbi:MAG: BlaI/MecI/CopY family transcriptional regulator [Actinomycetota bacterium]|nr:BlaI/MecI/CopY family transcriptional regulator [Actinomycetota bacterium]
MRGFGQLEAKIMDRLWSWERPATVRDVVDDLRTERGIAYTTVMTVMDNLFRKGWLQRDLDGRAYRYRPTSSRDHYAAALMRDALTSSADHVTTLMRFTEQLSADESEALRKAIRRLGRRNSAAGGTP